MSRNRHSILGHATGKNQRPAELMATLDALTNLRVVREPTSSSAWNLDVGAFPGWANPPEW
jgi:hypothetical protein